MSKTSSPTKSSLYIQISIVLVVGFFLMLLVAIRIAESEKESLVVRMKNVARVLHRTPLLKLKGVETDVTSADYKYIKDKLMLLKDSNPDARFVYLVGFKSERQKLFFYADSEPVNSPDYSPPGQIYEETNITQITNFKNGIPFAEGPIADRWGTWVTAFAPIFHPNTNAPIAMIGIDVSAEHFYKQIALGVAVPFMVSLSFALFLFMNYRFRSSKYVKELNYIKMEFSSFMSHEIRGYVTKMKSGLKMFIDQDVGKISAEQMAFASELFVSSNEFADLIEDFLDVAKIEQDSEVNLMKQDHNLIDIVKSVITDLRDQFLKKGVMLTYEGNFPERAFVSCDGGKVGRVFSNVIGNAIKYSYDKSQIRLGYIDGNTMHTLYIKDAGIGIPSSNTGGIFQKFFRADNARRVHISGTGLGMYFSKLIVEKHNGKIWFESTEGKGTTFYISLPKINPVH